MPPRRPRKSSRAKRIRAPAIAQSLAPLLAKVAATRPRPKATSALPLRTDVSATTTARALLGEVSPVRGAKRVSPRPPVAASKTGEHARAVAAAAPGGAHAFVVTRDEHELVGYRSDLGPVALSVFDVKRFRPGHELDLHGEHLHGLEARITRELRKLCARQIQSVLVIHGKGLHSPRGEGVLLEFVLAALTARQTAPFVRAFRTAPGRLGGSGALLVSLACYAGSK